MSASFLSQGCECGVVDLSLAKGEYMSASFLSQGCECGVVDLSLAKGEYMSASFLSQGCECGVVDLSLAKGEYMSASFLSQGCECGVVHLSLAKGEYMSASFLSQGCECGVVDLSLAKGEYMSASFLYHGCGCGVVDLSLAKGEYMSASFLYHGCECGVVHLSLAKGEYMSASFLSQGCECGVVDLSLAKGEYMSASFLSQGCECGVVDLSLAKGEYMSASFLYHGCECGVVDLSLAKGEYMSASFLSQGCECGVVDLSLAKGEYMSASFLSQGCECGVVDLSLAKASTCQPYFCLRVPKDSPPPSQRPPEPPGMYGMRSNVEQYAGPSGPRRPGNHIPFIQDGGQNEVLEKDVQLLNHCFDDIERFVARLQQAAEAYKELERRKRERGNRARKRQSGDGMLSHRARPPPASDFIDIFQKFKFSFNLLAKLKAHIHDPNAPELVHFLFTPLSLIYEASRDPFHGNRDLADQAISPVVNHEAKQLLLNCLTSKEIELWQALGPKWTTSREEWRGYTPPFNPVFYDGWRPSPSVIEDSPPPPPPQVPLEAAVLAHHNQIMNHTHESDTRPMPTYQEDDYQRRFEPPRPSPRPPSPRPPSPPRHAIQSTSAVYPEYVEQPQERNRPEMRRQSPTSSRDEENAAYLDELRRGGHQVYEALHERKGKNQKEISVNKGDILQVVDSSRKWWKVRNYKGEMGYAPYTILTEVKDLGYGTDLGRDRNSGNYNNFLPNDQPPAPPVPPPAPDIGRSRQPKRGDFKYF
ncbi:epidermal growth factor receptor kinase substrate 8-like [Haliotis rufescens]|uniref:epidermal growth factor receptor kinase substrate 8-like n=1 Tax=Haliotis rufescens TaxID=6454 RepID=UPI00201F50F8|nr:epidermal growth factor receptor kinase substrate 8-like [Haliotis rufescens]